MIIKLRDIEEIDHGSRIEAPLAINGDHVISIRQEIVEENPAEVGGTGNMIYAIFTMSHGEDIRIRIGLLDTIKGSTETPVWLTNLLVAFNK